MKHLRRRAYARASGFILKRRRNYYLMKSGLSIDITTSCLGSSGDRDDAVYNLMASLSKWGRRGYHDIR